MLGNGSDGSEGSARGYYGDLRGYQIDGVAWLERLRQMHLNGILADDMGLGKTLQAITAVTQHKIDDPDSLSIVVCPTSLVHNWKEEFTKFNPEIKNFARGRHARPAEKTVDGN